MQSDLELRTYLDVHLFGNGSEDEYKALGVPLDTPAYEASWEGLGLVVEAMRARTDPVLKRPYRLTIREGRDGKAYVTFTGDWAVQMGGAEHESIPLAAARAARAAIEAEKQGD